MEHLHRRLDQLALPATVVKQLLESPDPRTAVVRKLVVAEQQRTRALVLSCKPVAALALDGAANARTYSKSATK